MNYKIKLPTVNAISNNNRKTEYIIMFAMLNNVIPYARYNK